jgi:hypothetical protein
LQVLELLDKPPLQMRLLEPLLEMLLEPQRQVVEQVVEQPPVWVVWAPAQQEPPHLLVLAVWAGQVVEVVEVEVEVVAMVAAHHLPVVALLDQPTQMSG